MRDHAFDIDEVIVGCRFLLRQHTLGIENIQPLVFHRPHVEIINRNDVVDVEIILAPVDILVPPHRFLQRRHRMITMIDIVVLDIDAQTDFSP